MEQEAEHQQQGHSECRRPELDQLSRTPIIHPCDGRHGGVVESNQCLGGHRQEVDTYQSNIGTILNQVSEMNLLLDWNSDFHERFCLDPDHRTRDQEHHECRVSPHLVAPLVAVRVKHTGTKCCTIVGLCIGG